MITARNTDKGYQTILSNGENGILADEPLAEHGTGLGFAPYDLLCSSIAACKVMTIRYYARQKGWVLGDVHAQVEIETERKEQQTITRFRTQLRIEGDHLTPEQHTQLMRVADRCPVHRVLSGSITLEESATF